MVWALEYLKQANKDAKNLAAAGLKEKAEKLLQLLAQNPYQAPPPFEKLSGDMKGAYSRRINRQHRLVYSVDKKKHTVRILRMWTHYE